MEREIKSIEIVPDRITLNCDSIVLTNNVVAPDGAVPVEGIFKDEEPTE